MRLTYPFCKKCNNIGYIVKKKIEKRNKLKVILTICPECYGYIDFNLFSKGEKK